jgi:hypothetical protein
MLYTDSYEKIKSQFGGTNLPTTPFSKDSP